MSGRVIRELLDLWKTNFTVYIAVQFSTANRGFLNCAVFSQMSFPRNSQTEIDPCIEQNKQRNKDQNLQSWCFASSMSHNQWVSTLDFGWMNGQVHTGAGAEMEFPAELGSITGLHLLQIFFALLSFQIGSCCWSSRCFHCLLKAIAVCGQAVVFIYQLEAPARYSCVSHCTPFCCAMKYHSDYFFFNKHHTYGKNAHGKYIAVFIYAV